jgi:hypothetical protein
VVALSTRTRHGKCQSRGLTGLRVLWRVARWHPYGDVGNRGVLVGIVTGISLAVTLFVMIFAMQSGVTADKFVFAALVGVATAVALAAIFHRQAIAP